jgi:hypothetical protein
VSAERQTGEPARAHDGVIDPESTGSPSRRCREMAGTRVVQAMNRSHRVARWIWALTFAIVVMHLV